VPEGAQPDHGDRQDQGIDGPPFGLTGQRNHWKGKWAKFFSTSEA
jgi:fructosamine-3-kinase